MPTLDQKITDQKELLTRLLLYGPPKSRKTWWIGKAAMNNFNVILIDGDQGYHILAKEIPPEYRKRILVVEAADHMKSATFSVFMTHLLRKGKVLWDEEKRTVAQKAGDNVIQIDLNRMDQNTVFVLDSWTALVHSIAFRYAIENQIDLTDPEKTDWDGYMWTGSLASWMIQRLVCVPAHVAVIGHQTVYEKRSKDQKSIEWSRTQIRSTSGPHAMTMGEYFSDILYFHNISQTATKIDTRPDKDREGGSRLLPPGDFPWNELNFVDAVKSIGGIVPGKDNPYYDHSVSEDAVNPLYRGKSGGTIKQSDKPIEHKQEVKDEVKSQAESKPAGKVNLSSLGKLGKNKEFRNDW